MNHFTSWSVFLFLASQVVFLIVLELEPSPAWTMFRPAMSAMSFVLLGWSLSLHGVGSSFLVDHRLESYQKDIICYWKDFVKIGEASRNSPSLPGLSIVPSCHCSDIRWSDISFANCCYIFARRAQSLGDSTIRNCDNILVLKDGVVAEEGSHDELLENNGLNAEMWNMQLHSTSTSASQVNLVDLNAYNQTPPSIGANPTTTVPTQAWTCYQERWKLGTYFLFVTIVKISVTFRWAFSFYDSILVTYTSWLRMTWLETYTFRNRRRLTHFRVLQYLVSGPLQPVVWNVEPDQVKVAFTQNMDTFVLQWEQA